MSRARDIANYGDGIDTSSITSGTFADARIAQSNVTQHESAIDALGTVTSGTFNGTIGGNASMASSGLTVRNIEQVALSSNQSLSANGALTTFFSPTYTPKFSGSKVLGCLNIMMYNEKSGGAEGRKQIQMEFTGSDITNFTFGTENPNIGGYDYGASGIIIYYTNTIMGPLLTTSGTSTITCNCKLSNLDSGSGSLWQVYGNNTLSETFFTWIEYK